MPAPRDIDGDVELELELGLDEPDDEPSLRARAAAALRARADELPPVEVRRRAIDARRGRVRFHLTIGFAPATAPARAEPPPREVTGEPVIVVGAGPAGLFCAYELARAGIASIVVERGKPVQARRRDLKGLTQHGVVDPDSNYCFGEGGAGTYSDGKLYTRSHKRGDVRDVLEILAVHGAPPEILVDARPHIGSNKLPKVITAMRERLEACGVTFRFGARVVALLVEPAASSSGPAAAAPIAGTGTSSSGPVATARGADPGARTGLRRARGVRLADGTELVGRAIVMATGHSARDVHALLAEAGVELARKSFAVGVRVEHPQPYVDRAQYGRAAGHPRLRAAPYRLAYTPPGGRGVFSFCMCPGGWVVPAATEPDGVVVNGMSLSRRDSPYANSGLVIAIEEADLAIAGLADRGVDAGIELQRRLERAARVAGGGQLRAPAARVTDFVRGRVSSSLPSSSYEPGLTPADVAAVLAAAGPALDLAGKLRDALGVFDRQMRGFVSEEAVLIGVESRTSSPVRVPRDPTSLESPDLAALYPSGEGAGYAGGIVSAALDGIRVARAIAQAR